MIGKLLLVVFVAMGCGWAQTPAGRWDGTITIATLKVPFTINFEGSEKSLTGLFVNGDSRVSSTAGSFEAGVLRLTFGQLGSRMEATLADGQLKGTYGNGQQSVYSFTASKFCTCGFEGEAGPEITGSWEVPDIGWRLTIRRKGDDTLVTVARPSGELGPVTGRFDGLTFQLHYFDGVRAAVLEIEQGKKTDLNLVFKEPGAEVKTYQAVQAARKR